jgi:replicative DNA helicase
MNQIMYKIDEWDDVEAPSPTTGQAEIMIAKHRNGFESVRLKFIGHLGKFDNLENFTGRLR